MLGPQAQHGPLLLDGALGTELERRGASLKTRLWSAALLCGTEEQKELVRQVHLDYLRAGSDIITTASYQISHAAFQQEMGLSSTEAAACSRRAVDLAASAREQFCRERAQQEPRQPFIAFSCGPFGASLGDGSEYSGNYADYMSESELAQHHRQVIEPILDDPRVDMLCFETIPCLKEALAIANLLEELRPVKPAWMSLSCKSSTSICHGELFAEEVIPALWPCTHLTAVGVNCVRPPFVSQLLQDAHAKIQQLQQQEVEAQQGREGTQQGQSDSMGGSGSCSSRCRNAEALALVCYPNSGEGWDEEKRAWVESPEAAGPQSFAAQARSWVAAGGGALRILGGCCRTTPEHIQCMRNALAGYMYS
ncbi:Homocysteine S-methyltransferase [Dunaliella salina]|uniref:Homocysteine S-methyltransferase n=1 Tax=Dunaliella salina TaxID=3046 RepID=A0ABQ7GHF2_DUNSA|nr:Homocysteine S-methyltransferase [Dunaliella salina]|eukprot:KAF5834040.1 Homocysteine S-methyltransferase [Dunaliella salina]